jgi:hypothetical protein
MHAPAGTGNGEAASFVGGEEPEDELAVVRCPIRRWMDRVRESARVGRGAGLRGAKAAGRVGGVLLAERAVVGEGGVEALGKEAAGGPRGFRGMAQRAYEAVKRTEGGVKLSIIGGTNGGLEGRKKFVDLLDGALVQAMHLLV